MKTIYLYYLGRRIGAKDRSYFAFGDGEEKRYLFQGIKYCRIGQVYPASQNEKGEITIKASPDESDREPASDAQIAKWEAEDALARAFVRRKAMAAKMAREPRFLEVASRLAPLVAGLSYSQKRQLLEYILDEIG